MSLVNGLFSSDSIPAIEHVLRFVHLRHRQIANNIANVDTPHFRPRDLDADGFQTTLRRALDARGREQARGRSAGLAPLSGEGIRPSGGTFEMKASRSEHEAPMRHDGNTVSVEAEMSNLAKNALTQRIFTRLLVNRFRNLQTAIRGRV